MHRITSKTAFSPHLLLLFVLGVSSTRHQNSAWNNIVTGFTALAKDFGLEEANGPCIEYLRDDNTCMKKWKPGKLWRVVEENKIPILECNTVSNETVHHVCQLKTWFVILIILLIIIIFLIICGCICCCAWWFSGCCQKSSGHYHKKQKSAKQ